MNNINYKVAAYIRLSKEDLDKDNKIIKESESVVNQRQLILSFLNSNNYQLYDEYIDDGFSGTTFDRPNFERMIKDIEDKKINMVVTKDLSRLGRDYIQSGYYIEKYFPIKNVRYISINDNIDTGNDSFNNDIAPFKVLFNDMQSKDTSRKIRSILKNKKEQGLFLGSGASFGYKKDPKNKHKLIIDNKTAPIVKEIFELVLSGNSLNKTANILNKKGIITPILYKNKKVSPRFKRPGLWDASSIRNIIRNRIYIGDMIQGKQSKLNYKSSKRIILDESKWIIVEATHESIIDKEQFEMANRMVKSNKRTNLNRDKLLLEGLIYCKECGSLMGLKRDYRKNEMKWTLNCNAYIRNSKLGVCTSHFFIYDNLEKGILEHLRQQISNINIERINKVYFGEKDFNACGYSNKVKFLLEKRKDEYKKLNNLYDDKYKKIISQKSYIILNKEIEEKITDIDMEIQNLKIQNGKKGTMKRLKLADILDMLKNRQFLLLLIDKIYISYDKTIEINYTFK